MSYGFWFEFPPYVGEARYELEIIQYKPTRPSLVGRRFSIDTRNPPHIDPGFGVLHEQTDGGTIGVFLHSTGGNITSDDRFSAVVAETVAAGVGRVKYKDREGHPEALFLHETNGLTVQFDNHSIHTICDGLEYEWDFGDGSEKSELKNPEHTYQESGTYNVTLIAREPPPGQSSQKTLQITLEVQPIVDVRFTDNRADGRISLDEEVGISVDVKAPDNSAGFTGLNLVTNFALAPNLEIIEEPEVPDSFNLASGKERTFNWIVKPDNGGKFRISSRVKGKSSSGADVEDFDAQEGSVGLLDVEVVVDPDTDPIELEENEDGPIAKPVLVTVKITNPTDLDLTNIVLTPSKPSIVTLVERDVTADIPFTYTEEQQGEEPPTKINGAPEAVTLLHNLAAGESVEVEFQGQAQDDGKVKLKFKVTGESDGAESFGLGTAIVNVSSDILLYNEDEVSLSNTITTPQGNKVFMINGGDKWKVTIRLENRSAEKTLDVDLLPVTRGNSSYAVPVPLGFDAPDVTCPIGVRRTLEPGERETFIAEVFSSPDGAPKGEVGYLLTAWSHEISEIDNGGSVPERENILVKLDNDKQVLVQEGAAVVKPGTHETFHSTLVEIRDEPFDEEVSYGEWVGGFAKSGLNVFAEVIYLLPVLIDLSTDAIKAGAKPWKYPDYYSAAADKTAALLNDTYVNLGDAGREALRLGVIDSLTKAGWKAVDASVAFNKAIEDVWSPLQVAHAKGDSLAVANWYGGLSGNVASVVAGPETLLAKAAGRLSICKAVAFKAGKEAAVKISPRAVSAIRKGATGARAIAELTSATLKTMPNGALLRFRHARSLFGVDIATHNKLIEFTQKWKIVAVFRSRGKGAIQRLKSGRYSPKPQAIKAKNVSHIDRDWLGFKTSGAPNGVPDGVTDLVDEVAIRKPPKWNDVEAALKADGQSNEFIQEVRARHTKRTKEFDEEFARWNGFSKDGVPYPNSQTGVDFRENVDWGDFTDKSSPLKNLNFEVETIIAADGGIIYRPKIIKPDGTKQFVTGDMDPMAFLNPDGSPLNEAQRLALYKELPDLDIQHPESMTWTNDKGRNDYFHEFGSLNPDSEAMIAYLPNGTQMSTRFNTGKSWIDPKNIERSKWFFSGLHAVIRSEEATPVDISPIEYQRINISPNTTFINDSNCPGSKALKSIGKQVAAREDSGCTVEMTRDADAPTLRLTDESIIEKWTEENGWEPYKNQSPTIKMAPQTLITTESEAGTNTLEIRSDAEMLVVAGEDEWFSEGDHVVIDPGGPNQEFATVSGFGSLIFSDPLQNSHEPGEWISIVTAAVLADSDNDGIPDNNDAFPNNPFETVDTDNDGIGNNADSDDDNDGFSDAAETAAGTDPLDSNSRPQNLPIGPNEPIPTLSEWMIVLLAMMLLMYGGFSYKRRKRG
ncbi:MAG: PKD domain-containing protein [Cocleimonas sp.]